MASGFAIKSCLKSDIESEFARIEPLRVRWLPTPRRPTLVMLSGLPGVGKPYLAAAFPAVVVESDAVRTRLVAEPKFTPSESRRVFAVCHALIDRVIASGDSVIMDATNLIETHRERVHAIADGLGTRFLIV
jgi:predicted kinase